MAKTAEEMRKYKRDWIREARKSGRYVDPVCTPRHRRWKLRKVYGIDEETYAQMLTKQRDRCAVCRKTFEDTPDVDHDHESERVRGLLCRPCNLLIGLAKDDPNRLRAAAAYLED